MVVRIKAHFDGKTIVPDEPVDWPAGTPLTVEWAHPAGVAPAPTVEERLAALDRLKSLAVKGINLPDEALRRENFYED